MSTSTFSTFSERKTGREGLRYIFLMPKDSSVSKMHTAFCSYHDSTRVRGSSLTEQPKASARARATRMEL